MNEIQNNSFPQLTPQPTGNYFGESGKNGFSTTFKIKLKKWWDKIYYYARQVWPWVNRLINFVVYEIIKVLKAIVRIALSQIGLMKN